MFKFIIGFVLGFYVAMYGVSEVVNKLSDVYGEAKESVNEYSQKNNTSGSI